MKYYLRIEGEKGQFVEEEEIDRLTYDKVVKALIGPLTDLDVIDIIHEGRNHGRILKVRNR